ncbi:hypothetical protein ACOSQ4_033088 [Xanthoceras sorbifolium]
MMSKAVSTQGKVDKLNVICTIFSFWPTTAIITHNIPLVRDKINKGVLLVHVSSNKIDTKNKGDLQQPIEHPAKGTTTSSAPLTSTATNRRRMEVGSSSISAPVDSNNQTIPPTSATVTRVLWYSNTPAPSSNENQFGSSSQQNEIMVVELGDGDA